jgi:hypothetical protein
VSVHGAQGGSDHGVFRYAAVSFARGVEYGAHHRGVVEGRVLDGDADAAGWSGAVGCLRFVSLRSALRGVLREMGFVVWKAFFCMTQHRCRVHGSSFDGPEAYLFSMIFQNEDLVKSVGKIGPSFVIPKTSSS